MITNRLLNCPCTVWTCGVCLALENKFNYRDNCHPLTMSIKSNASIRDLCEFESDGEEDIRLSTLQAESDHLTATIQKLKNFKPELKNRVGRPRKTNHQQPNSSSTTSLKPGTKSDISPDIIELFESIASFTSKILKKIELIEKNSFNPSSKTDNFNPVNSLITGQSSFTGAPLFSEIVSKGLPHLEDKLDQIEQDSLKNCIKIEGEACTELLNKIERKERVDLKLEVSEVVKKVVPQLEPEAVESVTIAGKTKKHFKIKTNSFNNKISIIKFFKENKPRNLFVNEYVTKKRSLLLYQLKELKKNNSRIKAVYIFGGNVCAKINDNPRYFIINTPAFLEKFVNILNKTSDQNNNNSNE